MTDVWKQDGRVGTGSRQERCGDGSIHGKIIRALKGGAGSELVMETEAEGKW